MVQMVQPPLPWLGIINIKHLWFRIWSFFTIGNALFGEALPQMIVGTIAWLLASPLAKFLKWWLNPRARVSHKLNKVHRNYRALLIWFLSYKLIQDTINKEKHNQSVCLWDSSKIRKRKTACMFFQENSFHFYFMLTFFPFLAAVLGLKNNTNVAMISETGSILRKCWKTVKSHLILIAYLIWRNFKKFQPGRQQSEGVRSTSWRS